MSRIGLWMARRSQKAHFVESEIATRLVTKCGRQMEIVDAKGWVLAEASIAWPRCEQCVGRLP